MLRLILWLIGSLMTLVIVLLIVGFVLAVAGSPDVCNDHEVETSTKGASDARAKWDGFREELRSEGSAVVTLTEQEVTGRANEFVEEHDLAVDDLRVFFCPPDEDHPDGFGQLSASVGLGPLDADVVVRGTLDTEPTGEAIAIEEVAIGGLPGFSTAWVDGPVESIVEEEQLDIEEDITSVAFGDGTVTIEGRRR